MSLRNRPLPPVPDEIYKAVKGRKKPHPIVAFIDEVGEVFEAADFTEMYSTLGQSAIHPAQLAIASVLQNIEGLSDRQAAERTEDSLVWKYALRIGLYESGWDDSVYTEFRDRLLKSGSADLILDKILDLAGELGLLDTTKQRTDSTHILSAARLMSRIEFMHECVFDCLNELLDEAENFLVEIHKPSWRNRYFSERPYNYKLPKTDKARQKLANEVGADGKYIIERIDQSSARDKLSALQSVQILRRVLSEQYDDTNDGPKFKESKDLGPAGSRLSSNKDTDATCGSKKGKTWLGSKAHITETYGDHAPHLITNVLTTAAHLNDSLVLNDIHQSLWLKGFKPTVHLVDSGYVEVVKLSKCQSQHEIDVLTRITNGHTWQSKSGKGFEIQKFVVDWENRSVTCPAGCKSNSWKSRGGEDGIVNVSFSAMDCSGCPFKQDCTQASSRKLHMKAEPVFKFLQEHRARQDTDEFKAELSKRSGSEGTISHLARTTRIRRSPYLTRAKTHLNNVLAAAGTNVRRMGNWLLGLTPAETRKARYQMVFAAA